MFSLPEIHGDGGKARVTVFFRSFTRARASLYTIARGVS